MGKKILLALLLFIVIFGIYPKPVSATIICRGSASITYSTCSVGSLKLSCTNTSHTGTYGCAWYTLSGLGTVCMAVGPVSNTCTGSPGTYSCSGSESWTGTGCSTCDNTACVAGTTSCSQSCGSTTENCSCTSQCGTSYSWSTSASCKECGPYISAWSAWSASCGNATRTRTCSEDCGTNDCSGVTLNESQCFECGPYGTQTCGNWTQTYNCSASVSGCLECGPYGAPACGNWTQTFNCSAPVSGCLECGPSISAWTPACGSQTRTCTENCGTDNCLGVPLTQCTHCAPTVSAWSVCNPATHKRTRTCTENDGLCDGDDCAAFPLTEDCTGTVTGTLYDASDVSTCAEMVTRISGAGTALDFISSSWPPITSPVTVAADGTYGFTAYTPGNYRLDFQPLVNVGLIGDAQPKITCVSRDITFSGSIPTCLTQPCETLTGYNYGFNRKYSGWWNVTGGPVYAGATTGNSIESSIPASLPSFAPDMYLIKPGVTNNKGLLIHGGTYTLGSNPNAKINESETRYQGTNDSNVTYDYDFFNAKYSLINSDTTWDSPDLPAYSDTDGNGYMIIKYTGALPLTIGAKAVAAGQKYVVLVPGDINITGDITIANTGFLALISGGSITFSPAVSQAQGWFLASNTLNVQSTGDEATELQFQGTGSFIGQSGITLTRDRGVINNNAPSETFTYSTNQLLATPDIIKFPFRKFTPYQQ